jgi:ParB-like chromosome segregation protein Spo0J
MVKEKEKEGNGKAEVPRGTYELRYPEELTLVTEKDNALYDARALLPPDENFIKNIMTIGMIHTPSVRKVVGRDASGVLCEKWEIVHGRRRIAAAREINRRLSEAGMDRRRVCVRILRGDDKDLWGIACSENEHRRDDGPLEKARKAQKLLDQGKTDDEVCIVFGITPQCLGNWKSLLDLSTPVKRAVERGEIAATAAAHLVGLPSKEQVERLEEMKAGGGRITAERTFRAVRKGNGSPGRRIRSRKQIEERLETEKDQKVIETLRWVLNAGD